MLPIDQAAIIVAAIGIAVLSWAVLWLRKEIEK